MPHADACLVSLLPAEHLLVCVSAEHFAGGYRVEVTGAAADCACASFARDLRRQGRTKPAIARHLELDPTTATTNLARDSIAMP